MRKVKFYAFVSVSSMETTEGGVHIGIWMGERDRKELEKEFGDRLKKMLDYLGLGGTDEGVMVTFYRG